MRKSKVVTLVEEGPFEIMANIEYWWETQIEEGHGIHDLSGWSMVIDSLEIVIANESLTIKGVANVEKFLTAEQTQAILDMINIDDLILND